MQRMRDSVSAVIPTYNYGQFVSNAVESALCQTWRGGVEVIVVDDGSRDDTRRRLEPYGDRIRYIYQENRGPSAARNTGIRVARGEWVAMLDADDVWHPEKTEVQLEVAERAGGYDFIGSPDSREPMPERLPREVEIRRLGVEDILQETPICPSSVIVRRECFERVGGFDESLRIRRGPGYVVAPDRPLPCASGEQPLLVLPAACRADEQERGEDARELPGGPQEVLPPAPAALEESSAWAGRPNTSTALSPTWTRASTTRREACYCSR